MTTVDVESVGRRVESLLDRISSADPGARLAAEELVRELLELYGVALERLIGMLADAAPERIMSLGEDALLAGLLALHDLHPVDLRSRVEAAADEVRHTLSADITVVEASPQQVRLRVEGGCDSCGAAQVRAQLEEIVRATLPDVEHVQVTQARRAPNGLITPDRLQSRPASWTSP